MSTWWVFAAPMGSIARKFAMMSAVLTACLACETTAQTRPGLNCASVVVSSEAVAVPGGTPGLLACDLATGRCSPLATGRGVAWARLASLPGGVVSLSGGPGGASCAFRVPGSPSLWRSLAPSLLAGLIGISGALFGAWFSSALGRARERDKALVRWRIEMIERVEAAEAAGDVVTLGYPKDADLRTFAAVRRMRALIKSTVGRSPLTTSSADRSSYAKRMLAALEDVTD